MSTRTRKSIIEKRNIKTMIKFNEVIKSLVAMILGIVIAIVMFQIAFPIAVYKSIINSKRTKDDKK